MKIAPNQRQELNFLRDTLNQLESTVDRKARQNFRDLRQRLDDWTAKVAVIGQVKAGKSTFLNAFLHQHDFLPSDVNPWTSVVTNIRVNIPQDPATGARFEFFSENDWNEIIAGGSKIRKLTEQLLPGFDTEILRRQSEEMRDRAQKRLGRHYHALLGSHHDYDFLSADLLKRYVCAGPGSDDGLERESLGRYAALTKVANVYMRLPEFQVPTIITDTPGVNDPFLVRDEFTCRSLDKSDVFIVVLSAHQPLTDVDTALIRILAKQDSKDVIIFINRIDELDDYAVEVPRVMADVARRLQLAIPDIDFDIVAGSAHLADLAWREDEEAQALRAALDTQELADYLRMTHGVVPDDQFDRFLLASGLDDVKMTLSNIIDNGVGSQQLSQLLGDIRAELNAAQFVTRRERDSLQLQVESIRADVAEAAAEEMAKEIEEIRAIRDRLETQVENADSQIEKIVSRSWTALEKKLLDCIEMFIEDQKDQFRDRLFATNTRGGTPTTLDLDTTPLQIELEKAVMDTFSKSRAGTDVALSNCMHACRQAIHGKFDDPTESISLNDLPYQEFTSTLTLAKSSLRVGLVVDRSWAFWRKPTLNVEKSLAALRTIAAAELRPAVEKILAAYNEAQVERAAAGMSRVRVLLRMMDATLAEQTHRLRQDKAEIEKIAHDPAVHLSLVRRLQGQMEVLERRLLNLSTMDSLLANPQMSAAA